MTSQTPSVVVTTSWDDGHELDTRLAELLRANDIPGTFYIASDNVEIEPRKRLSDDALRDIAADFEVGGHTMRHLPLTELSDADAREEMRAGKEKLEDVTGRPVTSFCYPLGQYRPVHVRLAGEVGFAVARTVRRSSLEMASALEMVTTVNAYQHLVDGPLALRLSRLRPWQAAKYYFNWDELAMRWFDLCLADGGVYHLWGHSWEVDARGDWARLTRVLEYISGRPGVRYVTNGEVPGLVGAVA
jgi:peptidoglycan/xylan/chitin deacetylase (PgdA/CDA1 family)